MNLRHAAALALGGFGFALLVFALMPSYFLVTAFPEKPAVQIGPFATKSGCERARRKLVGTMMGSTSLTDDQIYQLSRFMVCL